MIRMFRDQAAILKSIAWMGGTSPFPYKSLSSAQRGFISRLFRAQVTTFRQYWGDMPNLDTCRIFFNRAQGDAHATLRDMGRP